MTTSTLISPTPAPLLQRESDTVAGPRSAPRQNWVLDPAQDTLLIIAAPLLSLALAVAAMWIYGPARGAALMITAHIVLTVAHHMPTFIRIYGDQDLFQRFKWNFIVGPLVPLLFCAGVLTYLNQRGLPLENFLYLYIFLSLWDPWHFLRQHFGFMRIYDRNNLAPRALASNMDWLVCATWFVHIMLASTDWAAGLLTDLYRNTNIPFWLVLSPRVLQGLITASFWSAVLASVAYVGFLYWCIRRGYYVSIAKLALLLCTFGVMYLTYTPNNLILALVPAWGFKVGFATVGIVHMTQYLAIVWRYDRRIAQTGRARKGWFDWLHSRNTRIGAGAAALVYVAFCIGYGELVTTSFDNRLLMSVLLAVGFTSTLMHYYFDGFIWRVRHAQNRQGLDLDVANRDGGERSPSWWDSGGGSTPARMLVRQLCYFGIPMAILTAGALTVWSGQSASYINYMYQAQALSEQGRARDAADAARQAYTRMAAELPFTESMVSIKPTAANEAALAFLIYNKSLYQHLVLPQLAGTMPGEAERRNHREQTTRAADLLLAALSSGGGLSHPGREQLDRDQARAIALSWQQAAGGR